MTYACQQDIPVSLMLCSQLLKALIVHRLHDILPVKQLADLCLLDIALLLQL